MNHIETGTEVVEDGLVEEYRDPLWPTRYRHIVNHLNGMNVLVLGSWDCPESPFSVCVYNDTQDTAHDFCIYCRKPEERK